MINKGSKVILYGLIFAVFFLAFFWRLINYYQFLGLLFLLWLFINPSRGVIQTRWKLYFSAIFLATIFSFDIFESLKYLFMFVLITLFAAIVKRIRGYRKILLKIFFLGSLFHCFFIILQYINPNLAEIFIKALVPPEVAERSSIGAYLSSGVCTGVSGEGAFAMLYSSFVFFYGFIKYILERKLYFIPIILLGLVCVLLNGKRIALLINVITAFVSYFLYLRTSNKKSGNITVIIVVVAIIIGVFTYTDLGSIMMEKNTALAESGDLSNGRADLNSQMLDIFRYNPVFGIGPFCTHMYIGVHLGHNIYLTTLSESGLIGLICLSILLLLNLKDSLVRFRMGDNSVYMYLSIYIQLFFIIYGFTGNPLYGPQFLITYILFSINENRYSNLS